MASRWAIEKAMQVLDGTWGNEPLPFQRDRIAEALDAAYRKGERRGRERAAAVVLSDEWITRLGIPDADQLEDDIRALPGDPPEDDRG